MQKQQTIRFYKMPFLNYMKFLGSWKGWEDYFLGGILILSLGKREDNSGNAVSAPRRKGGRRGNGGIGPNQENKAWERIAWRGPKPRHQGWESLPAHIVWSIGNFGCRILSQGRGMNEQKHLDNQMLLSTCFGAEITYILELMENLAARRNMDSWVNVCFRMLGKLHTLNSFSLPHLFRSLGKCCKHKWNAWLHISFSTLVSIPPCLGTPHLKGVLILKEREVLFWCDFFLWYPEPLPVYLRAWRLMSKCPQSSKGTHWYKTWLARTTAHHEPCT